MKTLVLFYSLEGHVRQLAEAIAEGTGAEVAELKPKDDIPSKGFLRYVKGGSQVLRKEKPEIRPLPADPSEYDILFIGSPVWAGGYTPALRTFFSNYNLEGKKAALFTSHRGGKGTALDQMAEALEGNVLAQKDFNEKNGMEQNCAEIKEWAQNIITAQG